MDGVTWVSFWAWAIDTSYKEGCIGFWRTYCHGFAFGTTCVVLAIVESCGLTIKWGWPMCLYIEL